MAKVILLALLFTVALAISSSAEHPNDDAVRNKRSFVNSEDEAVVDTQDEYEEESIEGWPLYLQDLWIKRGKKGGKKKNGKKKGGKYGGYSSSSSSSSSSKKKGKSDSKSDKEWTETLPDPSETATDTTTATQIPETAETTETTNTVGTTEITETVETTETTEVETTTGTTGYDPGNPPGWDQGWFPINT